MTPGLSPLELGWLVGMFDGEGSATIHRSTAKLKCGRPSYSADVLAVTNTDIAIIERVQQDLTAIGVNFKVREVGNKDRSERFSPCFSVRVGTGVECLTFLQTIEPFLTGKKQLQARSVIKFIEIRQGRGRCWKRNQIKNAELYAQDEAVYLGQPLTRKRELKSFHSGTKEPGLAN